MDTVARYTDQETVDRLMVFFASMLSPLRSVRNEVSIKQGFVSFTAAKAEKVAWVFRQVLSDID